MHVPSSQNPPGTEAVRHFRQAGTNFRNSPAHSLFPRARSGRNISIGKIIEVREACSYNLHLVTEPEFKVTSHPNPKVSVQSVNRDLYRKSVSPIMISVKRGYHAYLYFTPSC